MLRTQEQIREYLQGEKERRLKQREKQQQQKHKLQQQEYKRKQQHKQHQRKQEKQEQYKQEQQQRQQQIKLIRATLKIYKSTNLIDRATPEDEIYSTREEIQQAEERYEGKINWTLWNLLVNKTRNELKEI